MDVGLQSIPFFRYTIIFTAAHFFSGTRPRWQSNQKKMMLSYFKNHVKDKKALKKHECEKFLEKFEKDFEGVNWVRVKTFIFNVYRQEN